MSAGKAELGEALPPAAVTALTHAVARLTTTKRPVAGERLRTGVDLGTASIIVTVLGEQGLPLATELQVAQVARDGLVVDYIGAVDITKRLIGRLNERLGVELRTAAIAMPPGVDPAAGRAHQHVVEACGLAVSQVVDEPTAAGTLLGLSDGVVVDIGGGTTGLSVFADGAVTYAADEATGGTHVSLVLMGRYGMPFEQAEAMKQDPTRTAEIRTAAFPVMEKMASIVSRHIAGRPGVDVAYLVGGSAALPGIDGVFADALGIKVIVPPHPVMVTPVGIALNDSSA